MAVYASEAELLAHLDGDPAPAHADRLLELASGLVDEMLVGAIYATDSGGLPTDSRVAGALKRATLLQAQYMAATADELGIKDAFSSMSTGGVSWTKATGANGRTPTFRFSPAAVGYLRSSGAMAAMFAGRW